MSTIGAGTIGAGTIGNPSPFDLALPAPQFEVAGFVERQEGDPLGWLLTARRTRGVRRFAHYAAALEPTAAGLLTFNEFWGFGTGRNVSYGPSTPTRTTGAFPAGVDFHDGEPDEGPGDDLGYIGGLPAGEYELQVWFPGADDLTITVGQDLNPEEYPAPTGYSSRLFDHADGEPAVAFRFTIIDPDDKVQVWSSNAPVEGEPGFADNRGRYLLRVLPGATTHVAAAGTFSVAAPAGEYGPPSPIFSLAFVVDEAGDPGAAAAVGDDGRPGLALEPGRWRFTIGGEVTDAHDFHLEHVDDAGTVLEVVSQEDSTGRPLEFTVTIAAGDLIRFGCDDVDTTLAGVGVADAEWTAYRSNTVL